MVLPPDVPAVLPDNLFLSLLHLGLQPFYGNFPAHLLLFLWVVEAHHVLKGLFMLPLPSAPAAFHALGILAFRGGFCKYCPKLRGQVNRVYFSGINFQYHNREV